VNGYDAEDSAQPKSTTPFVTRADVLSIFASDKADEKYQDNAGRPRVITLQGTTYQIADIEMRGFGLIGKTLSEALDDLGLTDGSSKTLTLSPSESEDGVFEWDNWDSGSTHKFFTMSISLRKTGAKRAEQNEKLIQQCRTMWTEASALYAGKGSDFPFEISMVEGPKRLSSLIHNQSDFNIEWNSHLDSFDSAVNGIVREAEIATRTKGYVDETWANFTATMSKAVSGHNLYPEFITDVTGTRQAAVAQKDAAAKATETRTRAEAAKKLLLKYGRAVAMRQTK
jgi:hypothetical protein